MTFTTRFAPSPTGPLHLGHAYSALLAHDMAVARDGVFLLRIEDIDQSRARPEWEAQIYEDLRWLGLSWTMPVVRQSDRLDQYQQALKKLHAKGLIYPCYCSRKDITAAASAPQEGGEPVIGPDGVVYPGTCRPDGPVPPLDLAVPQRLHMARAFEQLCPDGAPLHFIETGESTAGQTGWVEVSCETACGEIGDVVLSRRDMGTSYHLSVVVDDAAQGVAEVIRGQDLFDATAIHVILQHLLDLPVPRYHHHGLIRDDAGKRLAKRDDARAIAKYRAEGASPDDIRAMVGLPAQSVIGDMSSTSSPSRTAV